MANFTKNMVIGLGGAATIHRSHFLDAVCDMETIMGEADSPVRAVVDRGFDRLRRRRCPCSGCSPSCRTRPRASCNVVCSPAVETPPTPARCRTYRAAATLSAAVNITFVAEPPRAGRVLVGPRGVPHDVAGQRGDLPDPHGDRGWRRARRAGSRRAALRRGPGHRRADPPPRLSRHSSHYRCRRARPGPRRGNLGAAAHLIHGSSEGRFRIVYCTDPATGGASRDEIEGVGYGWRSLPDVLTDLGVTARPRRPLPLTAGVSRSTSSRTRPSGCGA